MRINQKLILTCLAAVFALAAVSAASASASACTTKEGSKIYQLCINGAAATGTITAESTSAAPLNLNLEAWNGEAPYVTGVECTTSTKGEAASLKVEAANVAITGNPKTTGCSMHGNAEGVKQCKAKTTGFNEIEGKFTSLGNLKYQSATGSSFWEWEITGSECRKKTEMAMEGTWNCTISEPKAEATSHELSCASTTIFDAYRPETPTPLTYKQTISLGGTQKGQKFSFYEAT